MANKSVTKFLFLILFLFPALSYSQSTLSGSVIDSLSEEPLFGANISITGTSLGSSSNIEGTFKIQNIPDGSYTVKVTYIGYKPREYKITFNQKSTKALNPALLPDVIEGKEIVVVGQLAGQVAAINQQLSSNTIVNVVSEEKIQELPDVNAAEVIGRLPGVSISRSGGEANKIIVRGLSDRFSYVTVDGMRLPSTDLDTRGIDLSMISQGTLAGIELFKAITSDKDADAIAGTVNLVTKKAPEKRLLRLDGKGIYNQLKDYYKQYDFTLKYGERFFDNVVGVQLNANIENRDRSNEGITVEYGSAANNVNDWEILNFNLKFTDEIRKRGGLSVLFDINTPDNGSIKFSSIYNSTNRNYIDYTRNYPTGIEDLLYGARKREQDISNFNGSVRGENNIFDTDILWGASFGQSSTDFPYDFSLDFMEPSLVDSNGKVISKMDNVPNSSKKGPFEALIPYAKNNFEKAFANYGYYRSQKNLDIEKTLSLDLKRKYVLFDLLSGELKGGGKYRYKIRFKEQSELDAPYYLYGYHRYQKNPDGTVTLKNFNGTSFQNLFLNNAAIISKNLMGAAPGNRNIFDRYNLYPILNNDLLVEWYKLNKNGAINSDGSSPEYSRNGEIDADYYDIVERVGGAYLMNTFNYGQDVTFIAGVRMENEQNTYKSKYTEGKLTGFPTPSGTLKDTTATYDETMYLPNLQFILKPFDFLNVRLAAYQSIARPDYNQRLENYIARDGGGFTTLILGNSHLKSAIAWNYEINTSLYGNDIGLFSVSVFYKDIKNMFHLINGITVDRPTILDSLGIKWKSPFGQQQLYDLTYPYNSSKPTKVWGFEVEHQANLFFLPGLLSHIILSYNISLVKSETYIAASKTITWKDSIEVFPGTWVPRDNSKIELVEVKRKLEGQPELFGNVSLGYDIGGFSGRISVFYQSEYNSLFSGDSKTDEVTNRFTRWDLALKYKMNDNISFFFNINNLTNIEEGTSENNRVQGWKLLNVSQRYDLSADLGFRVEL